MSVLPQPDYGFAGRDGCTVGRPPARAKRNPYDHIPRCQRCCKPTPHCECADGPLRAPEQDPAREAGAR